MILMVSHLPSNTDKQKNLYSTPKIVLFHNDFTPSGEQPEHRISWVITTNCWLYSSISQISLLYETWVCYNKVDCTKSLDVCYWCVKIQKFWYMEHGLKHITFCVQKHIASLTICYNPSLVRDKPIGAPASVKFVCWSRDRMKLFVNLHKTLYIDDTGGKLWNNWRK